MNEAYIREIDELKAENAKLRSHINQLRAACERCKSWVPASYDDGQRLKAALAETEPKT